MIDDGMLKGHDVFAPLNVDEMHRVSTFSSVKQYEQGDTVFKTGDPASHFFVLMEGLVYIELPSEVPGFSLPILSVEKGELFGISPLFASPSYTSAAKCFEGTRVLAVEARPFRELLQQNCSAGMDIMTQIGRIYFTRYLGVIQRLQKVVG